MYVDGGVLYNCNHLFKCCLSISYLLYEKLYRDCMRLVKHIAPGDSAKSIAMKTMVRTEFVKNRNEKDEAKIEVQKGAAVRALANYMLYESGNKDAKLGKAMKRYHDSSVKSAKDDSIGIPQSNSNS